MITHDDKLFTATLLAAFAGSLLAVLGAGTNSKEAIADVPTAQRTACQPRAEPRDEPERARVEESRANVARDEPVALRVR